MRKLSVKTYAYYQGVTVEITGNNRKDCLGSLILTRHPEEKGSRLNQCVPSLGEGTSEKGRREMTKQHITKRKLCGDP